ncbi:hypothetical protein IEQ34_011368 [Dendrobium chrysotoxum]|uniref:Uncharacterized protein n=1 Tax=Dendrobium chrysotoxum TaxID=161865 RepID=A0AAV7GXB8_DENCH|nr:hypothetical protein IEQ34_011368 [Dendrobium chrysotoxum]
MANCTNLLDLDLSCNYLTGNLQQWTFLLRLRKIKVTENKQSGLIQIPTASSSTIIVLDISMNTFFENIPKEFQPNSSNFHTMINIQARHDDEKGIIQTLKVMKHTGCQYSSMLSSLLQAYKKAGRIEIIPSILQNMFYSSGVHHNAMLFHGQILFMVLSKIGWKMLHLIYLNKCLKNKQ